MTRYEREFAMLAPKHKPTQEERFRNNMNILNNEIAELYAEAARVGSIVDSANNMDKLLKERQDKRDQMQRDERVTVLRNWKDAVDPRIEVLM